MPEPKKRPYRKRARQEKEEQTRAAIVDAVVALHQELGPNKTTISAIAERAGVQRLTVYRHFPDEAALLKACSSRYTDLNPPPDPALWSEIEDERERAATALRAFFEYFESAAPMLDRIYRDAPDNETLKKIMDDFDNYLRQLADSIAGKEANEATRLTLRHLIRFSTWKSLDQENLDTPRKTGIALRWLEAARS